LQTIEAIIDGQYTHLRRITCDHGKWRGRRCWIEAHSGLCKKIRDVDTGEEHNFPLAIRLRAAGKGRAKMLLADGLTCWPRTISARVCRALETSKVFRMNEFTYDNVNCL
jgi:hypothetical protein